MKFKKIALTIALLAVSSGASAASSWEGVFDSRGLTIEDTRWLVKVKDPSEIQKAVNAALSDSKIDRHVIDDMPNTEPVQWQNGMAFWYANKEYEEGREWFFLIVRPSRQNTSVCYLGQTPKVVCGSSDPEDDNPVPASVVELVDNEMTFRALYQKGKRILIKQGKWTENGN